MSFHFEPTVDSSDDDDPVDLTAWQTTAEARPKTSSKGQTKTDTRHQVAAKSDGVDHETADVDVDVFEDSYEDAFAAMDRLEQAKSTGRAATTKKQDVRDEDEDQDEGGEEDVVEISHATTGFTSVNRPARDLASRTSTNGASRATRGSSGLPTQRWKLIPVITPDETDVDDYEDCTAGRDVVRLVEKEIVGSDGELLYKVEFEDRHVEEISFSRLRKLKNGSQALLNFENGVSVKAPPKAAMTSTRPSRKSANNFGFVSTIDAVPLSDEEDDDDSEAYRSRQGRKRKLEAQYVDQADSDSDGEDEEDLSEDDLAPRRSRRGARKGQAVRTSRRSTRFTSAKQSAAELEEDSSDDDMPFLDSNLSGSKRRKTQKSGRRRGASPDSDDDRFARRMGDRQSGRSTRHRGDMQEVGENQIYRSDSEGAARSPPKPKAQGARESFKTLPRNDEFRMRHNQHCDSCGEDGNFAPLIYCQGCTLAYHKSCLGHRTSREHLVTKVGEGDFVLQCRRCVAFPRSKDATAPDQGKCADCREHGNACRPFRRRKTPSQEQKERDENDGEDPVYEVDSSRLNQADNVMFRCLQCFRGFHFVHLPSRSDMIDIEMEVEAEQRFRDYSRDWKCKECLDMPAKPSGLIAWKPIDEDSYDGAMSVDTMDDDEKAYLVKWEGMSYFRASWMPGAWVWGVTAAAMRKAFAKREEAQHPKMRTEDAIPEDYLRADIVLDIKFTSIVDIRTEEIDKARIREIDRALIKYKGLGYEDAVWEAPPSPEDGDRWTDFVLAYNDWVLGRYVRQPRPNSIRSKLEKARQQDFAKLEKEQQPDILDGGELMKYQVEGLNWLYYKWYCQKNAILADEMGLGKTIQIIGFLATLIQDWNIFPFLIVVPNSTCPNWRRECKRWAPSLRVVTYYGSRESRDLSYRYELYPEKSKDLRCHIVVTSYEAASDDNSRRFLKSVNWQGLIVDEGQRLKNDKNQLYSSLGALKAPLRILLTGTPLQNNQRELFNLLHFLDETYDASKLEEEFADTQLDAQKISELHDLIRPFFLRRTKAQVLTFLPPMAQIILPISMTLVQKKLYRTILAKNPELMKAIFSSDQTAKQTERSSLNNVLMQLRKCLCHPFVYNKSIEERNVDFHASHRNLVDASSKLKLLELLLPKLRERGHRVLIFSQFLDMLDIVEDFLDGMAMTHQRLDGSIPALTKQKRIDEFNAPDSPLFAFLLSTRSGGVGINLASADTVIILDPDFNPHQDIQALSRAHRIGQKKKVLCFQCVTRASAEERIMQIGRKKLALDHVLIQEMDTDDTSESNLVSVLRHGAAELFEDSGDQDIQYDAASIERLLDRSHIENTRAGEDKTAEAQFSFARVWANDQGTLEDEMRDDVVEEAPNQGVWENILKERERAAAEEAAAKAGAFGRGRRARGNVDYANDKALEGADGLDLTPAKSKKMKTGDESDTDFQADDSDGDEEPDEPLEGRETDRDDLDTGDGERDDSKSTAKHATGRKPTDESDISGHVTSKRADVPSHPKSTFKRVTLPTARFVLSNTPAPPGLDLDDSHSSYAIPITEGVNCAACKTFHPVGSCPLKIAGVERCNLCGIAHFGSARVCPHIQSETQVRAMIEALKHSNEPAHLVYEARRYLQGVKGSLVQFKKQQELKRQQAIQAEAQAMYEQSRAPVWGHGHY